MNALILLVLSTYHLPQVTAPPAYFHGEMTPNYALQTGNGTTGPVTMMLRDSKGNWTVPLNGQYDKTIEQWQHLSDNLQTDTGMGVCGMDAHLHRSDNLCHRDGDDSALRVLPVPSPEVN